MTHPFAPGTVTAKFVVTHLADQSWRRGDGTVDKATLVRMGAVFHNTTTQQAKSENAIFGDATPNAHLDMTIRNEAAAELFVKDKEYYVIFQPVVPVSREDVARIERAIKAYNDNQESYVATYEAKGDHEMAGHYRASKERTIADMTFSLDLARAAYERQTGEKY